MIEEIKDLHPKLYVEVLRDLPDVIVLEDGKVQVGKAWTHQNIPTGIPAKVEASQIPCREWAAETRGRRITELVEEGRVGCGGHGEALGLDVIVGVPGIRERLTAGPPNNAGEVPIITAQRSKGISAHRERGVNGTPSLAVKISPNSHPLSGHAAAPENDFGEGTSQVPFRTRVRPMLKSERPRLNFGSNQCRLETELPNASPARVVELVSMLLPQV